MITTSELWDSLEAVLRSKGSSDAWIEYALPELQQAAIAYAGQAYGLGHADARRGTPLANPQGDPSLNIVTEDDGSRWLELMPPLSAAEHLAQFAKVVVKQPDTDSPEARAALAAQFAAPFSHDPFNVLSEDEQDRLDGFTLTDAIPWNQPGSTQQSLGAALAEHGNGGD